MLHGLYTGWLTLPRGIKGRTLLGRQVTRVAGTAPGGSDSLLARMSPAPSTGDLLITSVQVAPGNYALRVNQDGTYRYQAFNDGSRQTLTADGMQLATQSLYGEGALTLNDRPPQPAGGPGSNFFSNLVLSINQAVNIQLLAVDPDGDLVTFAVHAGGLPTGLSMSSTGLVTGTATAFGNFGVVTRISDPYGTFTDVTDTITVSNSLPNFVGQLLSVATPTLTALGLTNTGNTTLPSAQPLNTILSQSPLTGTSITPGGNVTFVLSDASLSVGNPNVFPQNIKGLTWEGDRTYNMKTVIQTAVTGKTTALKYSQFPFVEWEMNYELLDTAAALDDLKKIVSLFDQTQGQTNTFLYEDPAFNTVTAYQFATGDGTTKSFQLYAENANADGIGAVEIIQSVQPTPAIQIFDNGTLVSSSNYSVGPTGIVTFTTAPANTHALTWTGKFYYNCKFEQDSVDPNQFMKTFYSLQSLKFRSVLL